MPVVVGTGTATEPGVSGSSTSSFAGVRGTNTGDGVGVRGFASTNAAVRGDSETGNGVSGFAKGSFAGVRGENTGSGNGVGGFAANGDGVRGESRGGGAGVRGVSTNRERVGVVGENTAQGFAGLFVGNVDVRGSIFCDGDVILRNADCAEDFDLVADVAAEPGTVMKIDVDGALRPSTTAYDGCVAGVVSGAGDYRPALRLDSRAVLSGDVPRAPIALVGKVFCKVDATAAPIAVGDLLTTSNTPGHAMRAGDPGRAFGAVIGKALRPLAGGTGLIPILIALQ